MTGVCVCGRTEWWGVRTGWGGIAREYYYGIQIIFARSKSCHCTNTSARNATGAQKKSNRYPGHNLKKCPHCGGKVERMITSAGDSVQGRGMVW